jgi:branched-chain amino acid transport system substrate-binding protein
MEVGILSGTHRLTGGSGRTAWARRLVVWISALAALLTLAAACTRVSVSYDRPPSMRQAADENHFYFAELLLRRGELERAVRYFLKYQHDRPGRANAPLALLRAGETLIRLERYQEATRVLTDLVRLYPDSRWEPQGAFQLARAWFKAGKYQQAQRILTDRLPRLRERVLIVQYRFLLAKCAEKTGAYGAAVANYLWIIRHESGQLQAAALEGLKSAAGSAPSKQIEAILQTTPRGYIRAYLTLGLARALIRENQAPQAAQLLEKWLALNPGHPLAAEARDLMAQAKTMAQVKVTTVGAILPLSGRPGPFGHRVLKAITMALGVLGGAGGGTGSSGLNLVIRDSRGDPATAAKMVEDLVKNHQVSVIIGPMLSTCALAAAKKAQELGVPIIVMSQQPQVTLVGKNVFRHFLSGHVVVKALLDYAMGRLRMTRFAILYPNNAYGQNMMKVFWEEVKRRGGQVRGAEKYDVNQSDFGNVIRRLKSGGGTDFQALFIPDILGRVALIAPQLTYYGVDNVRIMGTNLLVTPDVSTRAGRSLENTIIVGGFNPKSEDPAIKSFAEQYERSFGRAPGVLEAYGYDTARIVRQILTQAPAPRSRQEVTDRLRALKDFAGITGLTSFDAQGEAVKQLPLLTIKNRELVPLK